MSLHVQLNERTAAHIPRANKVNQVEMTPEQSQCAFGKQAKVGGNQ